MIKNFYIGNFKAFGKTQKIPIKPITLIFGPNSSGKSSILQSLLFAQHINKTGDFDVHKTESGEFDLGGFSNYTYKHDPQNIITLSFNLPIETPFSYFIKDINSLIITIQFDGKQNYIAFNKFIITGDNKKLFEFSRYKSSKDKWIDSKRKHLLCRLECNYIAKDIIVKLKQKDYFNDLIQFHKLVDVHFEHTLNINTKNIDIIKGAKQVIINKHTGFIPRPSYQFSDEAYAWLTGESLEEYFNLFFERLFSNIKKTFDFELNKIKYLGPLRCYPKRHIFSSTLYDLNKYSTGEDDWNIILSDQKSRTKLNDWMEKIFNGNYEFKVRNFAEINKKGNLLVNGNKLNELHLYDKKWNVPLTHQDVGFGISQVIPIMVTSLTSNDKTVLIEQPELHLHPALQAKLGDLFIESALGKYKYNYKGDSTDNNNKFLIETHSEHLILRIMRRIRECYHDPEKYKKKTGLPPITPDDVAVLYVERQGNQSVVKEMRLDEEGYLIDEWPGGFFVERIDEVM